MDLGEQIKGINNQQEFVKIVNAVFIAKYGDDFQLIDGARSDDGNDGYVISEKKVLAIYCPSKPENKTDKSYKDKMFKDLAKAKKLHDSGKLDITKWTFITPGSLSNALIIYLRDKAKEVGFEGNHLEATYLADVLYRNLHLLEKFPQLYVSEIEAHLKKISKEIEDLKKPHAEHNEMPIYKGIFERVDQKEESSDGEKVIKILQQDQTVSSKSELKAIYYKTTDKTAQVNVILGLLHWSIPLEDKSEDMVQWCNEGIQLAEKLNSKFLRALFLSFKGVYLSEIWAREDMQMAYSIKMGNVVGVSIVSEEQRQNKINELNRIEDMFSDSFKEAVDVAAGLKNANILAQVCLNIGHAAGNRYIHLNALGIARSNSEKTLAKKMVLHAKDLFSAIGDDLGVGYALHNLAIQLNTFGENDESMAVNKTVIEIANKYGDESLLQTAGWLEETLRTGKIPDYIHGERRERKK